MRITFVTQWFDPEPGAMRGLPLAAWLAKRGHDVEVVTGFPNYPTGRTYPGYPMRPYRRESVRGVDLLRVPLYPNHDSSALRRVGNYASFALSAATIGTLLSHRPDVIYAYHPPATIGMPALLWKRLWGAPVVYHIADMWPESVTESGMVGNDRLRATTHRVLTWWCDLVYRATDAITVLSPGFKRLLVERGVDPAKVDVIYNWADEDIFRPMPREEKLAVELGMSDKFNVLYAGNLGHFQGLDAAISAAARLTHLPDLQLVLMGTGQSEADLKATVEARALRNVRFVSRRDYQEMGRVSALADVLLVTLQDLPFFSTTIPSKTQSAMAVGRPLVMAARGDAPHLIERAGAGLTCPPGDEAALAAAMETLYLSGRSNLDAMGARGRAFYLQELSLEAGGGRMESLFTEVIAKHCRLAGDEINAPGK